MTEEEIDQMSKSILKIEKTDSSSGVRESDKETRIAVVGNVDSGKSTIVGVLSKGVADDGRGAARSSVFNFCHESNNGRTSSIGQEIMGFSNNNEQVIPDKHTENKTK
jgi:GTPase